MNYRRQQGFTLVEVMIAVALSLILMTGITKLMTSSKFTYNQQHDQARLQENARFAMEFIGDDLRRAGYFGCTGVAPGSYPTLVGADGGGADPSYPAGSPAPVNASDVFMVSYTNTDATAFKVLYCPRSLATGVRQYHNRAAAGNIEDCTALPTTTPSESPLLESTTAIALYGNSDIPLYDSAIARMGDAVAGDKVLASDCLTTSPEQHIYDINFIDTSLVRLGYVDNSGNAQVGLHDTYNNAGKSYGAELRQLVAHRFFVAQEPVVADNPIRYTLYRDTPLDAVTGLPDFNLALNPAANNAEPLVEGIESMQIRYGIEIGTPDGVPNQYVVASGVTDWSLVIAVRVILLTVTDPRYNPAREALDRVYDGAGSADLDPVWSFRPTTKQQLHSRRKLFSTTIELRNNTL